MIRLKDEVGRWVHEIIPNPDGTYCIECSTYQVFAKLFEKDELIVKDLVDNYGFEIVE